MDKDCILLFPKKGDLGIAKNYWGITHTSIVVKIYNALLCNHIVPKIEKILRKNQNGFQRNWSTASQILTIRRILGVHSKNLEPTILFVDFCKAFDSLHRRMMEQILLGYGLPQKTVAAIMMLYKNMKVKFHSRWRHRLLQHCNRCAIRRHISSIPVYNLLRLCA